MRISQVFIHHPKAETLIRMLEPYLGGVTATAVSSSPASLPSESALIAFQPPDWLGLQTGIEWVHCSGAGTDGIEQVFKHPETVVTRTLGSLGRQLGEYALTYLLLRSQNLAERMSLARRRVWEPGLAEGRSLQGQRVVVAGTGACGQDIARVLSVQGVEVVGVSRSGAERECFSEVYQLSVLTDLLSTADALILALPETPDTLHLIRAEHFAKVRSLLLINLGRGSVVGGDVLLAAKRAGQIGMLVLDVFEEEPLPASSPFWSEPGVFVTPHVAAVTRQRDIVDDFLSSAESLGVEFLPRNALTPAP